MNKIVNQETITSLEIADLANKRHSDVITAIRKMEKSWVKVAKRNFTLGSYIDKNNQARPMYNLSKSESLYIGSKFNDEVRAKLVLRWEQLESQNNKPLSTLDMLEMSIKSIRENQEGLAEVRQELKELKAKATTSSDYLTIVGYATLNGVSCGLKMASSLGRKASALCKSRNIKTEHLPDPRFGVVKTYPRAVLEEIFTTAL